MHRTQVKLLQLAKSKDLKGLSLREIGRLVGEDHPQNVKHHLEQLESKGLLTPTGKGVKLNDFASKSLVNIDFVNVPILGSANCGNARILAEENYDGVLTVSKSMVLGKKNVFALKAEGYSMNKANIKGKSIDEGDYVLVDADVKRPDNGDYVVSSIDGCANIKKFCLDKINNQVVLFSESSQKIPPIFIDLNDYNNYMVLGRVFHVIKIPKS